MQAWFAPSFENEEHLKELFAEEWLYNPSNPFEAAKKVLGNDFERCSFAASNWPYDPFVNSVCRELITKNGKEKYLPDKYDFARRILELEENRALASDERNSRVRALEAAGKFLGMITRNETTVNNTKTINRVMIITESPSLEDWQIKARKQQKELTDGITKH
jgi:hypothetical protein